LIYLDTHIVVWLYAGLTDKFGAQTRDLMDAQDILISPVVILELQYLFDIDRIRHRPHIIISDLSGRIGLKICNKSFHSIILKSLELTWTRDPFDRIIVANAALNNDFLISKDNTIIANYAKTLC